MARYSFVFGVLHWWRFMFFSCIGNGRFSLFPRLSSFFMILVIYFPLVFLTEVSIRISLYLASIFLFLYYKSFLGVELSCS